MTLTKTEQRIGTVITFLVICLFWMYFTFSTAGMGDEGAFLIIFGSLTLLTLAFCFFVTRSFRKKNEPAAIDYLNISIQRYLLGLFMVFYGVPKLMGTFFDYQLFALDTKLAEVSEFELAWYYFGKNKWQELFSGIMEFIPGLLLLSRRTYYVAALILLPVTAQVFVLNFFFKIGGVTFPAATVLLACNIYILYSEKAHILTFFRSLDFTRKVQFSKGANRLIVTARRACFILIAFLIFMRVKNEVIKPAALTRYNQFVGAYNLVSMTRNGHPVDNADSIAYRDLYVERQARWNILRRGNQKTDAFVLDLHPKHDSIYLIINRGGIGDSPDIIDSTTILRAAYRLKGDQLNLHGIQYGDTVVMNYKKQKIEPKKWFW